MKWNWVSFLVGVGAGFVVGSGLFLLICAKRLVQQFMAMTGAEKIMKRIDFSRAADKPEGKPS